MIDFERVARASDDFWSDVEFDEVQCQVERLSPDEWDRFERQVVLLAGDLQERMAYLLGGIDTVASARVLLKLCARPERAAVLTAREAVRSLSLPTVKLAALDLWPSVVGATTNQVLDWIERWQPTQCR
ncbi:hypothetical protein [Rhizobacter sp. LjRoot28]|uniref:hypothetical protein n=1 Tax=Rhizobacter sp. LjRoot28 TaxID=3342309 RepID=UPI003ED152BA